MIVKGHRIRTAGKKAAEDNLYLIWSNEHHAWWRPDGSGYTRDPLKAGIFERHDALFTAWNCRDGWPREGISRPIQSLPSELPIRINDLPALVAEDVMMARTFGVPK